MSRISKSIKIESRLVVARSWGKGILDRKRTIGKNKGNVNKV